VHDVAEFLRKYDPSTGLDRATLDGLFERVEVEFFTGGAES
jgi:hypothetical protein